MNDWAIRIVGCVALAALITTAEIPPAHAGCVPWNSAGALISKNGLVPGNVIYKRVQAKTGGKVISANLCQNGKNFVYRVTVLGKKGDVKNLTVNAKTGQF